MRRPLCFVCILYILCNAVWLIFFQPQKPSPSYEEGEVLYITGCVDKKEYKDEKLTLYLKDIRSIEDKDSLEVKDSDKSVQENKEVKGVICYMQSPSLYEEDKQSMPKIGSYVRIKGRYAPFEHAGNEGQFDAKEYYQILNLDFSVRDSQILNQTKQYNFLREQLFELKETWKRGYKAYLNEEEAAFAIAIFLSDKAELDTEFKELFQRNGLAHLLAVSGLHITYLGMMLYKILKKLKLPEIVRVISSILLILLYGTMIEASGSTMRAIYMFLTYLFAKAIGRTYDMACALALAAMLLIMEQPLYLKYAGFWLSFGAVLAILIFCPFLKEVFELPSYLAEKKIMAKLWDAFLFSFGIQFFTMPILLFYYYEIPIYSVLLNLIVIPLFSVALISNLAGGAAASVAVDMGKAVASVAGDMGKAVASVAGDMGGAVASVAGDMGKPIAVSTVNISCMAGNGTLISSLTGKVAALLLLPLRGIFWVYQRLCGVADGFTAGRWIAGKPHMLQIIIFYAGIFGCMLLVNKMTTKDVPFNHASLDKEKKRMKRRTGVLVFFGMLFFTFVLCFRIRNYAEVTFLDVGQGDCCVIEAENGMTFLIDAGSSDVSECGKNRLIPFLKANAIRRIDYAFISHPDEDHMNAVIECLEKQQETGVYIKNIVLSAYGKGDAHYEEIKAAAKKANCKICYFLKGDKICIRQGEQDEMKLECLMPSGEEGFTDTNEQSLVIRMELYGRRILFTGDIGTEAEEKLIQQLEGEEEPQIDILKVAHHGSRFSSGEKLLRILEPKLAVINAGKNNKYGHPHKETLERLKDVESEILTTPECGAITVEIGEKIKIYGFTR